jgi:hypothetical protein
LWDFVLTLVTPRPGETPAQVARGDAVLASLRAHVVLTFAPRNCQRLYATGGDHG